MRLRDYELPPESLERDSSRLERSGRETPAVKRPEWKVPLARGEVDRVGLGIVDERSRRFQPAEHRIAAWLADRGAAVVALPEDPAVRERKPDARVDDHVTEFKSLQPGATDSTVNNRLLAAKGQARNIVIDARTSGLGEESAQRGIARFTGSPWGRDAFDSILILGEDFVIGRERAGDDGER